MRHQLRLSSSAVAIRVAIASAAALLVAGCSSESTRFAEGGSDLTPTATIPYTPAQTPRKPLLTGGTVNGIGASDAGTYAMGAAVSAVARPQHIETRALAPVAVRSVAAPAAALARPSLTPRPSLAAPPTPSPKVSLATPRPQPAPLTTASIAKPAPSPTGGAWSAEGGTPIVVAQGETASMLGNRYGVPTDALLRANGFSSPAQVQPGARLVIPVYNGARAQVTPKPRMTPVPKADPPPVVAAKPEKAAVAKIEQPAKQAAAPAPASKDKLRFVKGPEPAKAAPAPAPVKPVKAAEAKPVAPARTAAAQPEKAQAAKPVKAAEAKPVKAAAVVAPPAVKPSKPAKVEKPVETAKVEPKPEALARQQIAEVKPAKKPAAAPVEKPQPAVDRETTTGSVDPAAATAPEAGDKPEFRWPARGRVIQSFKAGANDGINIALPEGTSIKAAEGGTVAYAGSELKGYGNMVLIRHPNGYVSAYANNGDLQVKRGDKVTRGQTIAKSGQTGNVASPQLHFELRKGATPVDPTGYLAGL